MRNPYIHAMSCAHWEMKWCKDLRCYRFHDRKNDTPRKDLLVLGDRMIHQTWGFDTTAFFWRGQFSDAWACIDFNFDFKKALNWLHEAEDQENTEHYWVKNESR